MDELIKSHTVSTTTHFVLYVMVDYSGAIHQSMILYLSNTVGFGILRSCFTWNKSHRLQAHTSKGKIQRKQQFDIVLPVSVRCHPKNKASETINITSILSSRELSLYHPLDTKVLKYRQLVTPFAISFQRGRNGIWLFKIYQACQIQTAITKGIVQRVAFKFFGVYLLLFMARSIL